MSTIYWITRFDAINVITSVVSIIGIIVIIIITILYFIFNGQLIYDRSHHNINDVDAGEGYLKTIKQVLKYSIPVTVIFITINVFTPTTNQALLIYGVGGTIDYIKSNPVAKQLPDKCVLALDKWASTLIENDTTNIIKKYE